jgi:Sensors of blue-light using FAD
MTEAAGALGAETTFRLMYRSRNLIPADQVKKELGALFGAARSNNKRQHISGALLIDGEHYVQVLEGDELLVRELYEHIAKDARHDSVTLLQSGTVAERVFSRWSMAQVGQGDEADIPLIAHTDGISAAAGRRITPEQEAVLGVMRASAATTAST